MIRKFIFILELEKLEKENPEGYTQKTFEDLFIRYIKVDKTKNLTNTIKNMQWIKNVNSNNTRKMI